MTADFYTKQRRRVALVAGLYGLAALLGMMYFISQGEYIHATGVFFGASVGWKYIIDPLLADLPVSPGGNQ